MLMSENFSVLKRFSREALCFFSIRRIFMKVVFAIAVSLLVACGGGESGSDGAETKGGGDSTPGTITTDGVPVITVQPQSISVITGSTVSFSVTATGTPAPTYQWLKNGNAISGATSAGYTTPATTILDNGAKFQVVVSNSAGQVTSAEATLTVADSVTTTHWVSGYYVGYQRSQLPPEKIDWTGLTHIIMGAILAKADGTIDETFYIDSSNGPALATQIGTLAHQNGVKAVLMLGGAGNGQAILSAVTNHMDDFVDNLAACMTKYNYDGIDLDWEDYVDWDLFKTFASKLRTKLGNGKVLMIPVGMINPNYQSVDPKVVAIAPYVDQFNLMSYYPATAAAGAGWYSWHTSPLTGQKSNTPVSIQDSFQRYAAAGVPKAKLGMGIGFYAIGYTGGITAPNQPTDSASIVGGDNAYSLSYLFGALGSYDEKYRHWDSAAACSYLSLPSPDAFGALYVSFEDEASILAKGQFARDNGYGGIIIWTINQGYVGTHSNPSFLMQALRKAFIDPNASQAVGISVSPAITALGFGKTRQFKALVTGTTTKGVTWSATGGSINASGLYTAPSTAGTYRVRATSAADAAKYAEVTVSVMSDTSWNPHLTLHNCLSWWKEVRVTDSNTQSVVFVVIDKKGTETMTTMSSWGSNNFSTSIDCWSTSTNATKFRLYAYSSDGRSAKTPELDFATLSPLPTGSAEYTCPIEGPIE